MSIIEAIIAFTLIEIFVLLLYRSSYTLVQFVRNGERLIE